MNVKRGFTLVEISIAAALLTLVILSAFSVSSNSNKSFTAGTWRLNRQKEAQRFLLLFKENIERASHINQLMASGVMSRLRTMPIVVASQFYNVMGSANVNIGVLFAGICSPCQEANPELGFNTVVKGKGKDLSLEVFQNDLSLVITGNLSNTLPSAPAEAIVPRDMTNLIEFNINGDIISTLRDVASIGVMIRAADVPSDLNRPESLVTLKVTMVMPNSGGKTSVTEEITAKIPDRAIGEFIRSSTTAASVRRK